MLEQLSIFIECTNILCELNIDSSLFNLIYYIPLLVILDCGSSPLSIFVLSLILDPSLFVVSSKWAIQHIVLVMNIQFLGSIPTIEFANAFLLPY